MEKTAFLNLLQHYERTSVDEAKEIASLRAQYPYSQLLQTLAARASKDHGFQHQQRDLQFAAVYASDRALLKELIMLQPDEPAQQIVSKHVDADQEVVKTIDSVDVADVIMDDLERLSKLKNTFENLFMDYPKSGKGGKAGESKDKETAVSEEINPQTATVATTAISQDSATKSKKERIIEMAKALNNTTDGA